MKSCLALMLLLVAATAAAGNDWLAKATEAVRTLDYRGTLVYLRDGSMDTLQIVHRYRNGNEWERLFAKSGQRREIIRKNGEVTCVLPDQKLVLLTKNSRPKMLPGVGVDGNVEWGENYRIRELGARRQAGRMCRVIGIQAKDKFRYGYRLLIDMETNLPLKLALLYDGEVLEQLMFTDISFPETIPDSDLKSEFLTDEYQWVRHRALPPQPAPKTQILWGASKLPPGFELAETGARRIKDGVIVRQFLYTDGVATVSAFVAPSSGTHKFVGETTMGAVNAFGRRVKDHQITVVGEVPDVTVRWIAEHMQLETAKTLSAR